MKVTSNVRLQFAVTLLVVLAVFAVALTSAHAQSVVSASVSADPSTGQFICQASGIETIPPGAGWWGWEVLVDGSSVDQEFYDPGVGVMVPIDLDLYEPPSGGLHGYHTCEFTGFAVGAVGYTGNPWWDVKYSYTFP